MSRLISATTLNPVLYSENLFSDLSVVPHGHGTPVESLIEYAGRVCYRSTDKMGQSPNFLHARAEEGHLDIFEHGVVTVEFRNIEPGFFAKVREIYNACRYYEGTFFTRGGYITGSIRTWYDLFENGYFHKAINCLKAVSPLTFAKFDGPDIEPWTENSEHENYRNLVTPTPLILPTMTESGARVTLLGSNVVLHSSMVNHCYATFLIEGVSRAFTHQLVRHRLGSFSQESQRYVDLSKGGWKPIVPPSIRNNSQALALFEKSCEDLENSYRVLRDDYGIRKEDARFLLPNATETRIVVTMNFPGWRHFLNLRLPKAAQWEIREVARNIALDLDLLYNDYFHGVLKEYGL